MNESVRDAVRDVLPEVVELRRELHAHPEIRFEERWTSDRIARFLDEAGIAHTRGHAKGTGIVGVVEGAGDRTVALRADMDALEIQEKTGALYASRIKNRMHACGHDGHTACLCGAAKVLARHRALLKGRVKLIFQPAEENEGGGRYMVEEGVLDDVQAAFALHAWPTLPAGKAAIARHQVMAGADFFRIDIHGKGGHGANPGPTVDPIVVAAHIITALQTIVSRETDPWDAAVVTIGRVQAGSAPNIIPEHARLEGTFRALTRAERTRITAAIRRIAGTTAQAFRATAEMDLDEHGYPPLTNDPAMSAFAQETVRATFGAEALAEFTHPYMVAEDFAFYLDRVPGAFILLGNDAPEEADPPLLHTPRFNFNDEAIPMAVELLCTLALRFLNQVE